MHREVMVVFNSMILQYVLNFNVILHFGFSTHKLEASTTSHSPSEIKLDIQCIIIRWEAMMHQAAAVEVGADASCLRCASIPSIHLSVTE
jgi:hypothetical protein